MESILFEDSRILSEILHKVTDIDTERILKYINDFNDCYASSLENVRTSLYYEIEESFNGQKKGSRPELKAVTFRDFVNDCYKNNFFNLCYVMNKNQIKKFVINLNQEFSINLLSLKNDDISDLFASNLFHLYLSNISSIEHLYPSYIKMLEIIYKEE